jgi:hypothetical protein
VPGVPQRRAEPGERRYIPARTHRHDQDLHIASLHRSEKMSVLGRRAWDGARRGTTLDAGAHRGPVRTEAWMALMFLNGGSGW